MPPLALPKVSLAYSVPAVYTNLVQFTYINGVFRVTFFEQYLSAATEGSPEVTEVTAPRASVVMVSQVAADFLKEFGNLYNTIAKGVLEGAATVMPDDESGRMN